MTGDWTPIISVVAGGLCVWGLVRACAGEGMSGRRVKSCVAALIERGASVEYEGWTCYRSKADPPFVILQHDEFGNYVYMTEERFHCPDEAATQFLKQIAGGKREAVLASDGTM
jgi:hypothetical protein